MFLDIPDTVTKTLLNTYKCLYHKRFYGTTHRMFINEHSIFV